MFAEVTGVRDVYIGWNIRMRKHTIAALDHLLLLTQQSIWARWYEKH